MGGRSKSRLVIGPAFSSRIADLAQIIAAEGGKLPGFVALSRHVGLMDAVGAQIPSARGNMVPGRLRECRLI